MHSEPGYLGLDTYDVLTQHVVSHHFRFDDGRQAQLFRSPHRYIWPAELDLMAQLAGFELETRHADWTGAEFTAESRSHVSVYRLPVAAAAPNRRVAGRPAGEPQGCRAARAAEPPGAGALGRAGSRVSRRSALPGWRRRTSARPAG